MSEERITIDIDDTALVDYIAKLQTVLSLQLESFGTKDILKGVTTAKSQISDLEFTLRPITDQNEVLIHQLAQLGTADLPSLNREARLILGQIPGMRQAIWAYFRLKRLYGALGETIEVGTPTLSLYLTVIATLILAIRWWERRQRQIERRQFNYEMYIRRERGLTHDQYVNLMDTWANYTRSMPG